MPRRASAFSKIDQTLRVHALLHDIGVAPSPRLGVVARWHSVPRAAASGRGGHKQGVKGWSSYGTLELATDRGKIEIDYLDIVSMQNALSQYRKNLC